MDPVLLPIVLRGNKNLALVVGGRSVALRKVNWLREHGLRLRVVAAEPVALIAELAAAEPEAVELRRRPWQPADLEGVAVAIAATDSQAINAAVSAEARRRHIPVNVVDEPDLCTFYVPATLRRGDLEVAVSTGGANPALASRIRGELAETYPEWYADYAEALRWARERLKDRCRDAAVRRRVLARLAARECAEQLASLRGDQLRRAMIDRSDGWLRRETDTDEHRRDDAG